MHVRSERPGDIPRIRSVNRAAFDSVTEADLVDALRLQAHPFVSLVAVDDEVVVGHILFTPVTLSPQADVRILGLGPLAALPDRQRQGVGSMLVRAGLDECRRLGVDAVVVLGHAGYYPRFGFRPASTFGLTSEYDVPDDVFMAVELSDDALRDWSGVIRYHPAFAAV